MMQKNCEMHQDISVIFPTYGCPELSIFLKKYTTTQNNEDKDFILECAQKMTEPAQTEDEKERAINH
jgi:hypothetical protein